MRSTISGNGGAHSSQGIILAALALLCVIIVACGDSGPVCSAPYIVDGKTCCLDKDADGACDGSGTPGAGASGGAVAGGAMDCSLCPPQFVTQKEEVVVYRYVCQNKSVMDSAAKCGTAIISNAASFRPSDAQDEEYITSFDAEPACRGTVKAAELHLVLAKVPLNITYEVEDSPDAMPVPLLSFTGKDDSYRYIGFCDGTCGDLADAGLPPTSAYLVRAVLRYPERTVTTRDIIIDPTPDGEYGKKRCG